MIHHGPARDNAFVVINTWSLSAKTIGSTVKIGYLGWFALMAGIVALSADHGAGAVPLGARRCPPRGLHADGLDLRAEHLPP